MSDEEKAAHVRAVEDGWGGGLTTLADLAGNQPA